jgi:zinc protease
VIGPLCFVAALLTQLPGIATRDSGIGLDHGASAAAIHHAPLGTGTSNRFPSPESRLPIAADTTTQNFTVGGVTVILRKVTANDVVAANLYLLGGTRLVSFQNAGIEPFLLEATGRGTTGYPKDAIRRRMAELGTQIGVGADVDWTTFALRSTVAAFDSTWSVFADRLMRPSLDSAEVELVRTQLLSGLRQRRDNPDALLDYLADSVAYAGHSYGIEPAGYESSIARVTLGDLKKFQREQIVTSRMLLVVVGNVERPEVERLVTATLAKLPRGSYAWTPTPAPAPFTATVVTEQRTLPTNYIQGYYAGPPATGRDYYALRVATAVLSGRLFSEVRVKRNLTYAVDAAFVDRAQTSGGLYVTTVDPTATLNIMRQEISNLQSGWIATRGLDQVVQEFITEYFMKNETNADQANALARAQLYQGDWRHAGEFVDELRQVTPDDVRRVARQYMRNLRFAYVGDVSKLDRNLITRF